MLSRPWIERSLITTAAFSGGLAVSLTVALSFDLLPNPMSIAMDPTATIEADPASALGDADDSDIETAKNQPAQKKAAKKAPKKNSATIDADADPDLVALLGNLEALGGERPTAPSADSSKAPIPDFDREAILDDYDNRISDQFTVPADLRDRVGFWFDIYTKYDSERRVIHVSRQPWIIFKVVDVSPIIFSDKPKFRWMRNEKADKFVKEEMNRIRAAAHSVARKSSLTGLNEYEQLVVDALSKSGGNIQKQAAKVAGDIRVQTGQRNFFMEGLEISPRYLSTMEKIFRQHKLPVELTRLPFVESSFNKHATSKVGAAGIWQFMGNTGKKFMIVNEAIDERLSPFKATDGAARLLKENHMILHRSWPLAITAWNHGPGGVRKAMQAAGSRELGTIIARYNSKTFDFASSNFYSEFLAALHAERYNREVYGEIAREAELDLHVVKLPRAVRSSEIIRVSGLSVERFLMINPELKRAVKSNIALPAGFRIHVPYEARLSIETLLALNSDEPRKVSLDDRDRS